MAVGFYFIFFFGLVPKSTTTSGNARDSRFSARSISAAAAADDYEGGRDRCSDGRATGRLQLILATFQQIGYPALIRRRFSCPCLASSRPFRREETTGCRMPKGETNKTGGGAIRRKNFFPVSFARRCLPLFSHRQNYISSQSDVFRQWDIYRPTHTLIVTGQNVTYRL